MLTKLLPRVRASQKKKRKKKAERNDGTGGKSARGKGIQIVARACGERDDWLPKAEQVDIRLQPPGVQNTQDKARSSINLSREKKNTTAEIAPSAPDAKKKKKKSPIGIIATVL